MNVRAEIEFGGGAGGDVADAGDVNAFEQLAQIGGVEELSEVGNGRRTSEGDAINRAASEQRLDANKLLSLRANGAIDGDDINTRARAFERQRQEIARNRRAGNQNIEREQALRPAQIICQRLENSLRLELFRHDINMNLRVAQPDGCRLANRADVQVVQFARLMAQLTEAFQEIVNAVDAREDNPIVSIKILYRFV